MATALLLNAFYLQEEAARALRRGAPLHVLDEVLGKARRLGAGLVRVHANHADPAKRGDSAMRLGPHTDDALGWEALDHVIARAAAHGLQLVMVLGNQWDELGGARTYTGWAGLPAPRAADGRFFTDRATCTLYRAHVTQTLSRVSCVDGLRYGAHPAIAGWELLNEPRGHGLDRAGHGVREWIDQLGRTVRALAHERQWITTGEEGLDVSLEGRDAAFWRAAGARWLFRARTSFTLNARSPFVDHPCIHLYPESWGVRAKHLEAAGVQLIRESAAIARGVGKRLLIGELGVRVRGTLGDLATRRRVLRRWLDEAAAQDALAAGPWMLAHDSRPPRWDDYQFYVRDGLPLAHEANGVAPVIAAWAQR